MRLFLFHDPVHGFFWFTRVVFYIFLIDFLILPFNNELIERIEFCNLFQFFLGYPGLLIYFL
jgi:hypothetical protein